MNSANAAVVPRLALAKRRFWLMEWQVFILLLSVELLIAASSPWVLHLKGSWNRAWKAAWKTYGPESGLADSGRQNVVGTFV
jgi:hypothetical protein